ncbi:hypothetical protein MTR67_026659 [Solanum verrucosum]|uniref:ABC1 atypical kinase-like domain-containing protein n=1 Tax=Solanum verrucosum TaxID=315347 RepID=A0AAF0R844_SOLVR|nr:hypothetical protein MTR67_026659 [Solanum verrucosum]
MMAPFSHGNPLRRVRGRNKALYAIGMEVWVYDIRFLHQCKGGLERVGVGSFTTENYSLNPEEGHFDWAFCLGDASCYWVGFDYCVLLIGRRKPQLILLDHGLYKELDYNTRINYAALWKALVYSDADGIKENCVKLGAGDDLYALFAGILTMRPWNKVIDSSVDHLVVKGTDSDRSELQMYASQYFPQITELLRRLPRVILLMLKTNDCLRAVNGSLIQGPSLESFLIIGRVSSEAVLESMLLQKRSLFSWINFWIQKILLEGRLCVMHIAVWLLQLQKALTL